MTDTLEIKFILNETSIDVDLTLFSPEFYWFEDNFELDMLLANAAEQDILPGELLAKGILSELRKLNVHVSYEAECSIIDQCNQFAKFIDLEECTVYFSSKW